MPPKLANLGPQELLAVMVHPTQAWAMETVASLISDLRRCVEPTDYFGFQAELFAQVISVDQARAAVRRNLKRTRRGRPPVGSVAPDQERDPTDPESWRIEDVVLERAARQLRSVGDALAWRVSGFDRRYITALSQNAPPGPMAGKAGLESELDAVNCRMKNHGRFALLHDLTSCLRIGDLTDFYPDGRRRVVEIKSAPTKNAAQKQRMQVAVDAINHGAPLAFTGVQLVPSTQPFTTQLARMPDVIELAAEHGCRGMRVPGGRALIATDVPAALAMERFEDLAAWAPILNKERTSALKRAGISSARHHANMKTADWASRSPVAVPYGVYPISPADAAAIICDAVVVETVLSMDALVAAGQEAGLGAELLLPDADGELTDQSVARFRKGNRSLTVHGGWMRQVLAELVDLQCLFGGVHELLDLADPPRAPLLVYADESSTWR